MVVISVNGRRRGEVGDRVGGRSCRLELTVTDERRYYLQSKTIKSEELTFITPHRLAPIATAVSF